MKKGFLISVLALMSLVFTSSFAQGKRGDGHRPAKARFNEKSTTCQLGGLSDEQQKSLKAERVKFMTDIKAERNQLNELRAKKQTVETTEPLNKKELDKILVSMNKLSTSIRKKTIRHRQAIKGFLTEEQLLRFENKKLNRPGKRRGKGEMAMKGKGHGNKGHGKGQRGMGMNASGRADGKGCVQGKGRRTQMTNKGRKADCKLMTEDVREALKTARFEMEKQQQPYENQLNELRAQLKTICTGKNIDLKKADQIIDKQASVQLELAKLKSDFKSELRSRLTDEQKVMYDSKKGRSRNGRGHRRCYN